MNTQKKKLSNSLRFLNTALELINFISFTAGALLTGIYYARGFRLKYLVPMSFENELR